VQEEPLAVLNTSLRDLVGELRRTTVASMLLDFVAEQVVESAVVVAVIVAGAVAVALVYKKVGEELKLMTR